MRIHPVTFVWRQVDVVDADGVALRTLAMVPLQRYAVVAKRQYGEDGSEHTLTPLEERSMASHNQYFAAVGEGFKNLPEEIAPRFPSVEHLRGWLLCETGWCDEDEFTVDDEHSRKSLIKWIRDESPYAQIHQRGSKVLVRRPKSQSMAAMKKQAFQDSKRDVLDLLESMVRVPKGTLMREAGRSA